MVLLLQIYEKEKEAFFMRKRTKRMLSVLMAALMVVSIMPVTGSNNIVAKASTASAESSVVTWSAADILAAQEGDSGLVLCGSGWANNNATDDKTFEDGFSALGDNAKAGSTKAQTDGKTAAGTVPDNGCYVKYTASVNGTLAINTKIGKNKTFYVIAEDGTKVAEVKNGTSGSTYNTVKAEVEAGKTYYAYLGGATAQIWQVYFTPAEAEWLAADILASTTYNNGLTLCGTGWANNNATDDKTFDDGFSALGDNAKAGSAKAQTNGKNSAGTVPDSGCYIKYTAAANGELAIDTKIGKGKTFYIVAEDGTKAAEVKNSTDASTYNTVKAKVEAGKTYYAYLGGATAQIWKVYYSQLNKKTVVDWESVAKPVISKVEAGADGFTVTVEGIVDEYNGAEDIVVTMLHNDGQAGEAVIKRSEGTATVNFTAHESGDYTFVATAQRLGCADKASDVYEVKDFILGVKMPTITWAENKGNGEVYLDWVNISDAKDYTLTYKVKGSDESTAVKIDGITEGDYTVKNLTVGSTYEFSVVANRADGYCSAVSEKELSVTADAQKNWYVSTVGSAQETKATITEADGNAQVINIANGDTASKKVATVEAKDITNTTGSMEIQAKASGKISDDEDGFSYYYTKVNPEKENFELTATFTVTDASLTPDNQTGFGVVVADTLGVNNWGTPSYVHKYFNYFSSMMYSSKINAPTMRYITGYTSADTSNKDGVDRVNNNVKFNQLTGTDMFKVGAEYTFTVRKTDDGYEAVATTENGTQTQKLTANDFTSVQEDGTVVVGVMVARKIGVKITDIKFTTSESKGLATSEVVEDKVTPSIRVYSSNTCGAGEYEYTVVPNCAGTLKVTGSADGKAISKEVTADEVVRIPVAVNVGSNTIKAEFEPAAAANITSTTTVTSETNVTRKVYGEAGQTIIVTPDGKTTGDGTEESPLDINTAVSYAQPGQTILMKNGVYDKWITINRSVCGTADKPINLVAESISTDGTDGVVLSGAGLTVIGSYWHVYGLYVKDSSGVGIQVSGNYNTIDMCTVNHAANSGIQISRNGGADNYAGIQGKLWPTGNLIKNCESFDNCDAGRNDADGFAAKLTCGEGNRFYGCISHNNIDDGWDLYAKSVSGTIGSVTIENCVAYNNGWLTTDDVTAAGYNYGEGNGFKLGGGYLKGGHKLINCVSFGNHAKGITSNSCPDISITRCTAYNNGNANSYSIGLNTMDSMLKEWKVSGLISMSKADLTAKADLIPFSQHGDDNYIYNGSESYNNLGQKATDEWFESVDTTIRPSRNADGTIDMHNLLVIKSGVLSDNVGARLDTTSEEAISVKPQAGEVVSHVFEWTTTKEATCTEKGEKHGICTVCGHEETREIEALGHEFANEFTVDKEATTTEEGSKSQHCLHAGCTEKTNVTVIPKLTAGSEEVNPTPSTPDNKDDANVPSTGTDSSEKAPAAQTGDTMHAVPFALAMIISAGVVVIEISRKKKAVR
jgi:pectate lyase 9A